MTEDDGVRVTNRDVYNALIEFRKEFGDYVKEQGPKMALLEYKVKELEDSIKKFEDAVKHSEDREFSEKQNRKMYLWAFAGSSLAVEVINWMLFHK